ncbi:MAG: carboxynorspermidine decarboxylase [Methylococcales bacterium]|nr:carboxynorspermidine decarboxylase [Methylococcales bacterium]
MDFQLIKDSIPSSPAFVLHADEIISALKVLNTLRHRCRCKVLYSIKSLPLYSVLELVKPFVDGFSVSSLFEARLADEVLTGQGGIHLTTPGIRPDEWDDIARLVTLISFNSLTQYQRFASANPAKSSMGLRVNPKLSFLNDDRFDPCRTYSKLGVDIDELWQSSCLHQVKGLHIHNVYSATDFMPLIKTIEKLRGYFGKSLAQLDWLNLGGGYLFNQINDHRPFMELVSKLKNEFELDIYIEPGKAVVGSAGYLLTTVIDSFVSDGKTIAILDTSVNHNPEVFEYQRQPELHEHDVKGNYPAILAGCTCLAGDVFGEYRFNKPLAIGDKLVFKEVGAYSLVKANRFNGYNLPDIYLFQDQQLKKLKQYNYQDYRQQWLTH